MRSRQERIEDMALIARLQRTPCYREILRRLALGQSSRSIAIWLTQQKIEGPAGGWTVWYWRKLLEPLGREVKDAKERNLNATRRHARHPEQPPIEELTEALADVINPQELLGRSLTVRVREAWRDVDKVLDAISAERILKCAFLLQQQRIDNIMELETKLKLALPEGNKALDVLRRIGADLSKNEAYRKGLPVDDAGIMPPAHQSDLARRLSELDPVDRNLIRSATMKVYTMIEEGISGRFTLDGLEPDAEGDG
jgi:hypothetical protein